MAAWRRVRERPRWARAIAAAALVLLVVLPFEVATARPERRQQQQQQPGQPVLTGRRGRRRVEACMEDPGWNRRAHAVAPFDPSWNGTGPLAYGGVGGGALRTLDTMGPEVDEALEFARARGLLGAVGGGEGEGEVEVVRARRLECDLVMDGAECDQILWEVSLPRQQERDAVTAWLKPRVGVVDYLTVQQRPSSSSEQQGPPVTHHIAIAKDSHGHSSLMQHTHSGATTTEGTAPPSPSPPSLSIVSFNIWHTMAPAPADNTPKYEMYMKRLRHLADVIVRSDADVVGLQEVRYDEGFGPAGQHSQLEHLLELLPPGAYPHVVFQPAMSFASPASLKGAAGFPREEEGLAVLSRHTVRRSAHLLLPRDFADGGDGHQRVCLHAEVHKPGVGPVDVFTTHLSLSHRAREAAAVEIDAWAARHGRSPFQVLLGDFNAEPQEKSYRFLVGDAAAALHGRVGNWTDAWEAAATADEEAGQEAPAAGLTFPSWRPEKRIDFILYRDADTAATAAAATPGQCHDVPPEAAAAGPGGMTCDAPASSPSLRLARVELLGAEPTEETKDWAVKSMLEPGAPIWPSDHLGVYARFEGRAGQ